MADNLHFKLGSPATNIETLESQYGTFYLTGYDKDNQNSNRLYIGTSNAVGGVKPITAPTPYNLTVQVNGVTELNQYTGSDNTTVNLLLNNDGVYQEGNKHAAVHFAICGSAADTADKTVALTGFKAIAGARAHIRFLSTNTAESPTLNINGTGAKNIDFNTKLPYLIAGNIYTFIYDGTNYVLLDEYHRVDGLGGEGAEVFNHSNNIATGDYSHAEGFETQAIGDISHTEGGVTQAIGEASHAEGALAIAFGNYSHAEGVQTQATGEASHAEGVLASASGPGAHAEGNLTNAIGDYSHAEGTQTKAEGESSHAEGVGAIATGKYAHVEGYFTTAEGMDSHAEGYLTNAYGNDSHAEGKETETHGYAAHSEGYKTNADADYTHAEGEETHAFGKGSHTQGYKTYAEGIYSHAEGYENEAIGKASHAEGYLTLANEDYSHAEGVETQTYGIGAHAEGSRYYYSDLPEEPDSGGGEDPGAPVSLRSIEPLNEDEKILQEVESWEFETLDGEIYIINGSTAVGLSSHVEGIQTVSEGEGSHAEGRETYAGGHASHAEGYYSYTIGDGAHAEGHQTEAYGAYSHSEGHNTNAGNYAAHAEGYSSLARGIGAHAEGYSTNATGDYSHAEGEESYAWGQGAHAEGYNSQADGSYSHTEGYETYSAGKGAHAEGIGTQARHWGSHAEGEETIANGAASHAEGYQTETVAKYAHAEGKSTYASGEFSHAEGCASASSGDGSHAEGYNSYAEGDYSHAEGYQSNAKGKASHTEGGNLYLDGSELSTLPVEYNETTIYVNGPTAVGVQSHAEGAQTLAYGYSSHAEGYQAQAFGVHSHAEGYMGKAIGNNAHAEGASTIAKGYASHAEGSVTQAIGDYSHAEGLNTKAYGTASHAEGENNSAKGYASHTEGSENIAEGITSHAEGYTTSAIGNYSHAEGYNTSAIGNYSHASGLGTIASGEAETVIGRYNSTTPASLTGETITPLFIIGRGEDGDNRKNILEIGTLPNAGTSLMFGDLDHLAGFNFATSFNESYDIGVPDSYDSSFLLTGGLGTAGLMSANAYEMSIFGLTSTGFHNIGTSQSILENLNFAVYTALDNVSQLILRNSAQNPESMVLMEATGSKSYVQADEFRGALKGNADSATKLETARTIHVNLASTTAASFDGSANVSPGVTGTLPIANGGTGATTAAGVLTNLGITSTAAELNILDGATITISGNTITGNLTGTATNATNAITATNANNLKVNDTTANTNYYILGTAAGGGNNQTVYRAFNSAGSANKVGVYFNGSSGVLYGAAWNDYAEYRETKEEIEAGRVVCETGKGDLTLSTERLQPGAEIVSDTFGFAIGETETCKTAIAATGRVLAYPYEDRESYKAGDAVCAGPNGTVSKMTREEIREYPDRIIGTVSEIPEYETWGQTNVPVNGRIWIRIR